MQQLLKPELQAALKQAKKEGIPEQVIKTHFYAELEKRVYADRAHFLGDPDFIQVPVKTLVSDEYITKRSQTVLMDEISDSETIRHGKIETPETTHFSIMDSLGNAVSNTYTLNMPFGSGVVIPGAGFLMNDEMDDFSTKPGVANVFGVVGGKANEVAAEKRMLSSMSPTIVLKDNDIEMVVGTPGGSTIITSVFQTIINVAEEGMTAQQAVDAPRVHHQLLPKDQIAYNPELPETVKEELQAMGYNLKKNNYMGDVQLILKQDQKLTAASDQRGRGVSEVFEVESF
ncbi:MAG: gamma-glutamyltransferase [Pseudomonadota bacterium]|nr:gamma-glutamyltransferase [Pseudomonadota bacterium]